MFLFFFCFGNRGQGGEVRGEKGAPNREWGGVFLRRGGGVGRTGLGGCLWGWGLNICFGVEIPTKSLFAHS